MLSSRGRPPLYAERIRAVRVEDGWVPVCHQANRTAPSGFRSRYPGYDFRSVRVEGEEKPYVLEVRKL